jgi:hypothetical protein
MKNVSIILICLLSFGIANAQDDKFTQAMLTNLEKSKTATTATELQELANSFERIAISEKRQWTAWYHAALYNILANFKETDITRRQKYLDHALKLVDEGIKIRPEESEFLVLKVLAYYGEMAIDPSKGADLYPKTVELLEQAKTLNPNNPRVYLTQGEALFGMPEAFGGGKDKAKPVLLAAKERFDKFVPADQLVPNWGKQRCEMLIGQCSASK